MSNINVAQRFRSSIPFLFSIALLVFWWAILPLLAPIDGSFDASRPVNYWSLITPDRIGLVATTWLAFMLVAIITDVIAWEYYRGCIFATSWILIGLAIASSLCVVFLYLLIDADPELRHIQTIDYQGHKYQLAVSSDSHGWDYEVSTYIIFECDHTGDICRELTSLQPGIVPIEPSLVLSSDQTKLLLRQRANQIQIKP